MGQSSHLGTHLLLFNRTRLFKSAAIKNSNFLMKCRILGYIEGPSLCLPTKTDRFFIDLCSGYAFCFLAVIFCSSSLDSTSENVYTF